MKNIVAEECVSQLRNSNHGIHVIPKLQHTAKIAQTLHSMGAPLIVFHQILKRLSNHTEKFAQMAKRPINFLMEEAAHPGVIVFLTQPNMLHMSNLSGKNTTKKEVFLQ